MNEKIIFFAKITWKSQSYDLLESCMKIEKSIVNLFGIIFEHIFWYNISDGK